MANDLTRGPIFVVGPSRSGTSMVREMLNRNDAVWITRETHYFDDLRQRRAGRDEIEAYFARIGTAAYGASTDGADRQRESLRLRVAATALGGTPDAYFESFCRLRAQDQGRPNWGEKTPRHVMQVATMLELYPDAKVVCLVRDPRAVVASYRDWTRRAALSPDRDSVFAADRSRARSSYGLLLSSLMCAASLRAGTRALREFGPDRVRLLRFEDLVHAPRETLVDLCDWLGLPFAEAMIDVPLVQSSYDGAVRQGVSTEPVNRWRTKLSKQEIAVVELACSRVMHELAYDRVSEGHAWRAVVTAAVSLPGDVVRAARVNRTRISKPISYAWRRLSLSLGSR
ncbi:MAG TPA: sulfotransferase [Gaiellaceae bacterium]|nr:sulfotransferase [Gaiellaceae bacterium]